MPLQAAEAVKTASVVLSFMCREGPHVSAVRASLCAPATLAAALGNLAAVYALFTRFPGALSVLSAGTVLHTVRPVHASSGLCDIWRGISS